MKKRRYAKNFQYFVKDKVILRFNNISIDTSYYKTKGGLQDSSKNRKEESLKSAIFLNKKYPELTKISQKKKSGITEIELIRKK